MLTINYYFHFVYSRKQSFERTGNVFFISSRFASNRNSTKESMVTPLYSSSISKVVLIIIRDTATLSTTARLEISEIFKRAWIHIVFMTFAVIMLFFLRLGNLMLENNFTMAYVDVMAVVTGGGTIRYRDKLEKIFFGFLLLGSFYVNAICIENLLFAEFLIKAPERIDTFEKLAKCNIPIYAFNLEINHPAIQSFKYEFYYIFLNSTFLNIAVFSDKRLKD